MAKRIMTFAVAALWLLLPLRVGAQNELFSVDEMPNAVNYLPAPPDTASADFMYDLIRYQWGKQQRLDRERAAQAVSDADWGVSVVCRIFSQPFGMEISKDSTPELYRLLEMSVATCDLATHKAKERYRRKRPYTRMCEPSLVPRDEEELRENGSYPSGHTMLGWSSALVLMEVNPAAQDALLARGYAYGESRVIAGFHWQSDVNAAMLAASAAVARLHTSDRFQEQMRKAKAEFAKKRKKVKF